MRFCSLLGLGINELIQGVLTFQKQGTGDQATVSPFAPQPLQKHTSVHLHPLFRKQSCLKSLQTELQSALYITFFKNKLDSLVKLKKQAWTLESRRVTLGPSV